MKKKTIRTYVYSISIALFSCYFFIIPFTTLIYNLRDPGLYNGEIPKFTYQWHQKLSGNFATWANERINSHKAKNLNIQDISGTEWPMFGAVYFLWSTEALQSNWEKDHTVASTMPKVYAKAAIEAAAKLIVDTNNAIWVKEHWGDDYLHQENVFYRMLLIAGLTSYQELLGDKQYQPMLIDQVNSLSNELDASPHGLLDDYPGQCYPVDVLPAIAVIQRAGKLLGLDHSDFITRAKRGFENNFIDEQTGLPAYFAQSKTGIGLGPARGVGISYMLIWTPELWPDTAQQWYLNYDNYFWKEGSVISGFREFSKNSSYEKWFFDIDSGPVINEYGVAASAFGIGAARANNRFEQAYQLSAEALVASWPLPNGTLLIPRMLSNLSDAPYLGETALLFNMTRKPINEAAEAQKKKLPLFVYIMLFLYLFFGVVMMRSSIRMIARIIKPEA